MKPVVNCHCHFLNFAFVPDRATRLLSRIPEGLADDAWLGVAGGALFAIVPGKKYDRIKSFLKTYRSTFPEVAARYLGEREAAEFDICTPLMMDLEQACPGDLGNNIPYVEQVRLMSEFALHPEYAWRVFPFVMFDPRRPTADGVSAADLCIRALASHGVLGVKMYPALGYSPDPGQADLALLPDGHPDHAGARALVRDNLERLYAFCGANRIPITTHTSTGGAYSTQIDDREGGAWHFTEVSNWLAPMRKHGLVVNFAHFGGNYLHDDSGKGSQSVSWRRQIRNLLRITRDFGGMGEAYADVSYHDMALDRVLRKTYFKDLSACLDHPLEGRGILFGTDASMISHTWNEREYAAPFRRHLREDHLRALMVDNPLRFLFGSEGIIPDRYVDALRQANGGNLPALPRWVAHQDGRHRVVQAD